MRKLRNWSAFMYHYALGLTPSGAYVFRNGARLMIGRAIDHVPILEIFLDEEYGTIPDGAVVLDIGANIGVFTIYATTSARDVRVYAYEPLAEFCALLEENVRLNQKTESVRCFNYAVAAEAGDRYLQVSDRFFPTLVGRTDCGKQEDLPIRATTLGQIMAENHLARVDLLKMDCEGAEYEILYSTPSSELEKMNEIRMEYHNLDAGDRHVEALKRFLIKGGFIIAHLHPTSELNGTLWARREPARSPTGMTP